MIRASGGNQTLESAGQSGSLPDDAKFKGTNRLIPSSVQAIAPTIDSEKRGDGQLTAEQVFSDCDTVGIGREARGAAFLSSCASLWVAAGVILAVVSGTALPLVLPASEKLATTAIPPIQTAPAADEALSSTGADNSTIFTTGGEIVSAVSP